MKYVKMLSLLLTFLIFCSCLISCVNNDSSSEDKWQAMVNHGILKPTRIHIRIYDAASSQILPSRSLNEESISDFIDFLKNKNIVFDEIAVTDNDLEAILVRSYSISMASFSGEDYANAKDKIELSFTIGKNGYIYLNSKSEIWGETLIRSTEPIEFEKVTDFYNSAE